MPKVSIIVPCYNQAQYLNEALQSVLYQTYTNWECIIVNDGSSDNTEELAQKWISRDSKFFYLYQENGGLSSARNYGIEKAKGEFILPLDADDKIGCQYVTLAVKSFREDKSLKIVYCKAEKFGDTEGLWSLAPFSIYDLCLFNMIFCSAVFKKEDWKSVGGYDVNMIYGLEDWEFWIAILKNGGNVKCMDTIGFYYRIRANSMARSINDKERDYTECYVAKKHFEFYKVNYNFLNKNRKFVENSLKSEKFVINLFSKMFFGFKIFKTMKSKLLE
jgi:glycosyltransferase involved in cell wall biosynthesis